MERNPGNATTSHLEHSHLISIITPVYNAARWLPKTLASVRAQTYSNWEHIFVDDGSTDSSRAIIEDAAREDSRIRLLRTPHNSGPSSARNIAIDAAQGRFLAFLDADDLWLPQKLMLSVVWITALNYDFIYHDYRHMSHDGARVGPVIASPPELDLRTLHVRRGHGGCTSIVIDRERVPNFHFPQDCEYLHEDFCAWLSMIKAGHIGHRLPVDLARYRISRTSRSANKLKAAAETWRIYREESHLPLLRAASWWTRYSWNAFWLHLYAQPH